MFTKHFESQYCQYKKKIATILDSFTTTRLHSNVQHFIYSNSYPVNSDHSVKGKYLFFLRCKHVFVCMVNVKHIVLASTKGASHSNVNCNESDTELRN